LFHGSGFGMALAGPWEMVWEKIELDITRLLSENERRKENSPMKIGEFS
jgi:hypothetical protein